LGKDSKRMKLREKKERNKETEKNVGG